MPISISALREASALAANPILSDLGAGGVIPACLDQGHG